MPLPQRHRWFTLRQQPGTGGSGPQCGTSALNLARDEFADRHPDLTFGPVVAVIAAYEEEDNIGDVLKAMPESVRGLGVSTLVVVDGGDDGTDRVAIESGVATCVLPVNLGHGAALRLGYELALAHGARYVVTLDADGQNDPAEMGASSPPCSTTRRIS